MEKLGIEPATPGLQGIGLSPTPFCGFLGINQFRRVGLRFVYWFYVGNTQRLSESGFIKKPGIVPATPGLHETGFSSTPRRLPFMLEYIVR